MNLKDSIQDFFSGITNERDNRENDYDWTRLDLIHHGEGLCITCTNKPHCIWKENNKNYCEHYE